MYYSPSGSTIRITAASIPTALLSVSAMTLGSRVMQGHCEHNFCLTLPVLAQTRRSGWWEVLAGASRALCAYSPPPWIHLSTGIASVQAHGHHNLNENGVNYSWKIRVSVNITWICEALFCNSSFPVIFQLAFHSPNGLPSCFENKSVIHSINSPGMLVWCRGQVVGNANCSVFHLLLLKEVKWNCHRVVPRTVAVLFTAGEVYQFTYLQWRKHYRANLIHLKTVQLPILGAECFQPVV